MKWPQVEGDHSKGAVRGRQTKLLRRAGLKTRLMGDYMRLVKLVFQGLILLFSTLDLFAASNRQKVILDCDLGGDIDDAFAMALVLTSPEFEVLGITLDHGLTEKRAQV